MSEPASRRARAALGGSAATAALRSSAVLIGVALLPACSRLPAYEATAAALTAAGRFSTEWKPMTRDLSASLTDEEDLRGKFWLSSCVNELAARFTPAPESAVRALQIAECMQARGWHLVVVESPALSSVPAAGVSQR